MGRAIRSKKSTPAVSSVYLRCRHRGHAWDDIPVTEKRTANAVIWFRCERCASERHDEINRFNGELISRKYIYPTGYKLPKDEKPTIQSLRIFEIKYIKGKIRRIQI